MSDFNTYLHELFVELGPITIRRMFGGAGVFHEGLMIGLVADETLYLKVDATTVERFEAEELGPFTYAKNGRSINMSYYQAPPEAMDDATAMLPWAKLAYEAAVRSNA